MSFINESCGWAFIIPIVKTKNVSMVNIIFIGGIVYGGNLISWAF